MMKKRRALSEIVGAVVIMAVVISGLGIYTVLAESRIIGEAQSVKESLVQSGNQISEQVEFIAMFRNDTQSDVIEVYLHNHGLKNITITDAFVNGTIDMKDISNPIYVRDLNGITISPDNKTIPLGVTSKLVLNFTGNISVTNGIDNLVIRTDSNKLIQIINDTK